MCVQFYAVQVVLSAQGTGYCYDADGNLYRWRGVYEFDKTPSTWSSKKKKTRLYRDYWLHVSPLAGSKCRDDVDADIKAGTVLWSASK